MAVGTRLRGNSGLLLTFKKGAAAAVAVGDDVKQWELTPEPKDDSDLTFAEAGSGLGADWTLSLTAITAFSTGSLWNFLWDNPGSDVVVVLAPYGNTTPTATQPHFTGTFNTGLKPGIANEATGPGGEGAEFEVELAGVTDVTRVIA